MPVLYPDIQRQPLTKENILRALEMTPQPAMVPFGQAGRAGHMLRELLQRNVQTSRLSDVQTPMVGASIRRLLKGARPYTPEFPMMGEGGSMLRLHETVPEGWYARELADRFGSTSANEIDKLRNIMRVPIRIPNPPR